MLLDSSLHYTEQKVQIVTHVLDVRMRQLPFQQHASPSRGEYFDFVLGEQ